MPTLRVIGAGRAGSSIEAALRGAGWATLAALHHEDDLGQAAEGCDLLVLAVPDDAVAAVAQRVVPVPGTVVAHLAGSLPPEAVRPHERRGVLHPIVALPDASGAPRLVGAWFAVAGDPLVLDVVQALGGRSFAVTGENRAAHHAACAMAANHVTALLGVVERVAAGAGLPLAPYTALAAGAVAAVAETGPARALTGPVSRGDWATVGSHLDALAEDDRPAYLALASEAARLAGRTLPPGLGLDGPVRLLGSAAQGRGAPAHGSAPLAAEAGVDGSAGGTGCRLTVLHEKPALRTTLDEARGAGLRVGLVPTMGALHEGHAALIRQAAAECDLVTVSIFVNPLQFDRPADLAAYPRTLDDDLAMAAQAGAAVVFAPSVAEMYGPSAAVQVHIRGLADRLEGASRPGHFDGVATVCTKLFGMAGACRAYFGEKDFQQVAVVRRLVHDLDLPVEVVACPIVRGGDGLALSSRNALLTTEERAAAPALARALRAGAATATAGERSPEVIAAAVRDELAGEPRVRLDRVDVVDADTLDPPGEHTARLRILAAAYLGQVRLIDNLGVEL